MTRWDGVFLLGDDGQVTDSRSFGDDPAAIVASWEVLEAGRILEAERNLVAGAPDRVRVDDERLLKLEGTLLSAAGLTCPEPEDRDLFHRLMVEQASAAVRHGSADRSHQLIQAVLALDEFHKMVNLASERLVDWYAFQFPELSAAASPVESMALVARHGDPEAILASGEVGDLRRFLGVEVRGTDAEAVRSLARVGDEMERYRTELESFVESITLELAPNLVGLVGPSIAARLITSARGLIRLATWPASTIQVLGAEKALFAHLRDGKKPPKHGLIFAHPWVNESPWWLRGRVARHLACKIVIVARADAFTGRDIATEMKSTVEDHVKALRRKHPSPPKKQTGRPHSGRGGGRPVRRGRRGRGRGRGGGRRD